MLCTLQSKVNGWTFKHHRQENVLFYFVSCTSYSSNVVVNAVGGIIQLTEIFKFKMPNFGTLIIQYRFFSSIRGNGLSFLTDKVL